MRLMLRSFAMVVVLAAGCSSDGTDAGGAGGEDSATTGTEDTVEDTGSVEDSGPVEDTVLCESTCDGSGTTKCDDDGAVTTCSDHDGDGCTEWGGSSPCSGSLVCKEGHCAVSCEDECDVAGSRQCDQNSVQTCSDHDADGCLEWGGGQACLSGTVCKSGFCSVDCDGTNECTVQGAKKCEGNGFVACSDLDFDGCLEWGDVIGCPGGQFCSSGSCAADCSDECNVVGAKQCDGTGGYQSCGEFDGDGCLEWGMGVSCNSDEVCSNGFCSKDCLSECSVIGATKCNGDAVQSCGDSNDDACLEWGTAVACDAGLKCSNGHCAIGCTDECSVSGSKTCEGSGFKACSDSDEDGCLEWGTVVNCDVGQSCSNGQCSTQCTDECNVVGVKKCLGDAVQLCGNTDGDTCLEWGTPTPCGSGEVCSNGFCASDCTDECTTVGAGVCDADAVKTCEATDDGCLKFGEPVACGNEQSCSSGKCSNTCTDECNVIGAKKCQGEAVQICGDTDSDTCLEWGTAAPCASGQGCSGGFCTAGCTDECTVKGAKACEGSGVKECDDYDTDGCLEWGTVTACAGEQSCSNGSCSSSCTDECVTLGSKQCSGNGVQTCGNTDADSCLEWGTPSACDAGLSCVSGNCALSCVDECTVVGGRQCSGASSFQLCDDYNEDGCLEWGTAVSCSGDDVCSGGNCALNCTDECSIVGSKQCNAAATAYQACDDHDTDGCLEWGNDVACGDGQACSAGQCAEQCSDECASKDMTQCNVSGTGVQTCDDYNTDGCLQWGTAAQCGASESCTGGTCAATTAPGKVVINEVLYDDQGSDENAFVELFGPANLDLSGFTLVGVNGSNGQDYQSIALSGSLSADGYFVITTADASAELLAVAQQLSPDVDYQNGPETIQLRWGATVVDAVGYGNFAPGETFAGEGGFGLDVSSGLSLGRDAVSTDTDDNSVDFSGYDVWTPGSANVSDNDKPTAELSCPSSVPSDEEVTVDASGSLDPDGTIVGYQFQWGDGFDSSGPSPIGTHTYGSPGTQTITVTVTDDVGGQDTATCVVVLTDANAPAVLLIKPAADLQVTQGSVVSFITADVTAAPGRTVDSTRLVIDGVPVGDADTIAPYVFEYTVPLTAVTNSTVLVQVQATDDEDAIGISPARQLFVKNDKPVADLSAVISNNLEVTVNAAGCNDTETATADLEVRFDWENDGVYDTEWSTEKGTAHTYVDDGEHTIAVQVKDEVGQTDSTTRTVNFQSVQDVSGTVNSTLWYGTINVTGDINVPVGETLQVAPGTTVVFLEFDQDNNDIGDFDLTVDGTFEVLGTEAEPVLFTTFDTDGADNPASWGKIVLKGTGNSISHATFEYGYTALEIQKTATLDNVEFRDNTRGLTVSGGSASVTATNVLVHRSADDGITVSQGALIADGIVSRDNGKRGFYFANSSGSQIDNCTVISNGDHGIEVISSSVGFDTCSVLTNERAGVSYVNNSSGLLTHANIRNNKMEGVRARRGASGNPTPTIRYNNIFENGTVGTMMVQTINLSKSTTNTFTSGNSSSSPWSAPGGSRIVLLNAAYSETTSASAISGSVIVGGTTLKTWGSGSSASWYDVESVEDNATSVVAQVSDTYYYGLGTTTVSQVVHEGGPTGVQLTSFVTGGTVDARYNYFGAWPDVLSVVSYASAAQLDIEGFVGVPFEEDWDIGPYRGGQTLTGDVVWDTDIFITGNVTVAAGASLTVNPGTTVTFVPTDQDSSGRGDWSLDGGAGTLHLAGTSVMPITVDVLGAIPADGGGVGMKGSLGGAVTIEHTTVESLFNGLEVKAGTTTLTDVSFSDCRNTGLTSTGSATVGATGCTFEQNETGVYVQSTGAVDIDQSSFIDNTVWGLHATSSANPLNTVTNATFTGNMHGAVQLVNSHLVLDQSNLKFNGYGVFLIGGVTGTVSASNIQSNNYEGVVMARSASGTNPTLAVSGNNIYANTVLRQLTQTAINLAKSTSNTFTSGNSDSSAWTAPDSGTVLLFESQYSETSAASAISGAVLGSANATLKSWGTGASASWTQPTGSHSQLKARVSDTYYYGLGTTTITRVIHDVLADGGAEATIWRTSSGKYDLTGNYWGLVVPTATQVIEINANTADFTAFKTTPISGTGPQ